MTDEDRPDLPSAESSVEPVAVSLMITRRQRAELRDRGFTDEAVGLMTPAEAHALLRQPEGL